MKIDGSRSFWEENNLVRRIKVNFGSITVLLGRGNFV